MDTRIERPIPAPQSKIHAKKKKAIASRYMDLLSRNPKIARNQVGQKKSKTKK